MTSTITTETFEAPGATITYDVRGTVGDDVPLLLIGCPMGAEGFGTLANLLPERTVVTYDPRGVGRSVRSDGSGELRPEDHAGDLHRLVEVLGGGPVDVMASSGGAVNALAWVARHGDDVRTLVAHEPPLATLLPDREALASAIEEMHRTYQRDGIGQGMAGFVFMVGVDGELTDGFRFPPLDPAQFGLPAEDDGRRDDALLGQNLRGVTGYRPDVEALRSTSTRVVVARGAASGRRWRRARRTPWRRCSGRARRLPRAPRRVPRRRVRHAGRTRALRAAAARGARHGSLPRSGA